VQREIPHLLRLEKRGRSLLAAWSAEFAGVFVPTGHHLIVDSGESLPELTENNSFLSIKGRVQALRLAIRGETITAPKKPTAWPQLHGGWHALGDRGGQPSFMRGHERNLADSDALRGQLRSHTGDYLTRDFIYDAKVLGDGQIRFGTDANSATLRIRGGNVELLQGELRARSITRLYTEGPHVLRLAKTGSTLSIGVADTADGPILPLRSIPRLATALPGLNVHNGFLHANGRIAALRLVVDDKPLPPPRRPKVDHPTRMQPHAILNPRAKDVGRFAATDLARRDFVFDLQYRFKPNSKSVLQVGLGHGGKKLLARLHGEGHGNSANLLLGGAESLIGKVPGPGPHWIRVSKLGSTLSFAITVNHDEEFAPFFSRTIPDLVTAAPWCAVMQASFSKAVMSCWRPS
jgi:hypothetical protein